MTNKVLCRYFGVQTSTFQKDCQHSVNLLQTNVNTQEAQCEYTANTL